MRKHKYTHVDSTGLRWRFDGTRPISEFADGLDAEFGKWKLTHQQVVAALELKPIKRKNKRK